MKQAGEVGGTWSLRESRASRAAGALGMQSLCRTVL